MSIIQVAVFDPQLALALAKAGYPPEYRDDANGPAFVALVDCKGALRLAEILLRIVAADPPAASLLAEPIAHLMHWGQMRR